MEISDKESAQLNAAHGSETQLNHESLFRETQEVNAALASDSVFAEESKKVEYPRELELGNSATSTNAYEEDIARIREEAEELSKEYPNIVLAQEIDNDPFTADLLARGYSLRSIYELKYPGVAEERFYKTQKNQVIENIKARNAKPKSIGSAGAFNSYRDIGNMSDEEIMAIDSRIKKGQRVTL